MYTSLMDCLHTPIRVRTRVSRIYPAMDTVEYPSGRMVPIEPTVGNPAEILDTIIDLRGGLLKDYNPGYGSFLGISISELTAQARVQSINSFRIAFDNAPWDHRPSLIEKFKIEVDLFNAFLISELNSGCEECHRWTTGIYNLLQPILGWIADIERNCAQALQRTGFLPYCCETCLSHSHNDTHMRQDDSNEADGEIQTPQNHGNAHEVQDDMTDNDSSGAENEEIEREFRNLIAGTNLRYLRQVHVLYSSN